MKHILSLGILVTFAAVIVAALVVLPSTINPVFLPAEHVDMDNVAEDDGFPTTDSDDDNIPDVEENHELGTNPFSSDTDADGMPDGWEIEMRVYSNITEEYNLDPANASDAEFDPDGDGLKNLDEYLFGTFPSAHDSDNDGMSDGWEVRFAVWDTSNGRWSLDPMDPGDAICEDRCDYDGDGILSLSEYLNHTNPNNKDTDGDGLDDFIEIMDLETNPTAADTDEDSMPDGWEVKYSLNPLNNSDAIADKDGDGLVNLLEYLLGTSPINPDSDDDGMPDGWEVQYSLDPMDPDDAESDPDGDNLTSAEEYLLINDPDIEASTNPRNNDTDGDGLNDSFEVNTDWDDDKEGIQGTNPIKRDTDNDGLSDFLEVNGTVNPQDENQTFYTNPRFEDSDGDGLTDYDEIYKYQTHPELSDTDSDRLNDFEELFIYFTLPFNPDTDTDGLTDGDEIKPIRYDDKTDTEHPQMPTDPLNPDSDGDGMHDGWEIRNGWWDASKTTRSPSSMCYKPDGWWTLDPADPCDKWEDIDGDELANFKEFGWSVDPNNPDTDGDDMPDGWEDLHTKYDENEGLYNLDPGNPEDRDQDADMDGFRDIYNSDGDYANDKIVFPFTNYQEYLVGSHPNDMDSDGDRLPDGFELGYFDWDRDGLLYWQEVLLYNTDPFNPDTDGDGSKDGEEINIYGTDPNNPNDYGGG